MSCTAPHPRSDPWARRALVGIAAATLVGCGGGSTMDPDGQPPPQSYDVALMEVVSGLQSPVFLAAPPGDARLFVVEQAGRIRIVKQGALLGSPFLDLTGPVVSGGERGLLGLAFHPDYVENGRFYVSYTGAGGRSVIERYEVSPNPDVADASSGVTLLEVDQPFDNHNGGQVSFGPDGYLYIALGDGGSGGDPLGNGQDPSTLLGTLLRLDVDGGTPYAIPPDNPFADGAGGRPEIWAYGLRNPWRFAHDPHDGLLYIADVGQGSREEVNVAPDDAPGANYGWNVMEGEICYQGGACNQAGLSLPATTYAHGSGSGRGCSITGGYVYRGSAIPELLGMYLYGDYCEGWVRALRFEAGEVREHVEILPPGTGSITSFGVDGAGEMYVVLRNGRILRLESGGT